MEATVQLNTLQTNTGDDTERRELHKEAEADTSSSRVSSVAAAWCFFRIAVCGAASQSLVSPPFVFFQVQNLTLAFQAAESVGIKPSLVSGRAAHPTHTHTHHALSLQRSHEQTSSLWSAQ